VFPILAAVCFFLVLIHASLGGIDLLALGLLFMALGLLVGPWPLGPWWVRMPGRAVPPP